MSDTLANAIQSSLINATGAQNQGVKRQTFAVLRETTAPAVLLELGFLSNPQEAARLNTSAYQETLANAIVAGLSVIILFITNRLREFYSSLFFYFKGAKTLA